MAVTLEPFTVSLGRAKRHRRIRSDYDKGAKLRSGQGGAVAGELVVPARPLVCLAGRWGHMRLCAAAETAMHTHMHTCPHTETAMHTHKHS